MKSDKTNFARFLRELKQRDAEIGQELDRSVAKTRSESTARGDSRQIVDETIVLLQGRPVLDVKNSGAVLDIDEIESQVWKARITNAVDKLKPHIPAIGRIEVVNFPDPRLNWLGTGWLVRDNIIVTNRHVANAFVERAGARFLFQTGLDGTPVRASIDFIEEFGNDAASEFPLFEIVHVERSDGHDVAFLRIEPVGGRELPQPIPIDGTQANEGEQVAVVGYPARDENFPDLAAMDRIFNGRYDKKRLAPGLVSRVTSNRVFHDCSTLGGNSGSEIISLRTGKAVALHFAGTIFTTNHAVPIHIVHELLDRTVRPVGGSSRPTGVSDGIERPIVRSPSARILEATIPVRIRVEIGDVQNGSGNIVVNAGDYSSGTPFRPAPQPATGIQVLDPNADDDLIEMTEGRVEDYLDRKGYDSNFMGEGNEIPLPKVRKHKEDVLKFEFDDEETAELLYMNFTVVMSKKRRQCRYSACNIDGKKYKRTSRPGWRLDPRIPKELQIIKECYGNPPKFSRGHMTRREDPAWGSQAEANLGNADSMHVTNAVPQIQSFNGTVWLALEDYALQNAKKDKMRLCVFTGPFLYDQEFGHTEITRYGVYIPTTFWKIIAFIHDDTEELTATGYTMSQESFLQHEREEFIFGRFKTHQVPIQTIEHRSGLIFGELHRVDPLRDQPESFQTQLTMPKQIKWI